jgi:hypothetical protein
VNRGIVDTLIGKLLIDPDTDDTDLNNPITALQIFKLQGENNGDEGEKVEAKIYLISINNVLQFRLITSFISVGLSFCQCKRYSKHQRRNQLGSNWMYWYVKSDQVGLIFMYNGLPNVTHYLSIRVGIFNGLQ